jgi:acetylglutamate kinase
MKVVIKVGGATLEDGELLHGCARAIAGLASWGHQVAVVHGGGAALTRALAQMGKKSEFVNGLRVTDRETRDVALRVLAGEMNKKLVAVLHRAGQAAVGVAGGDGGLFLARKKNGGGVDLGFVGEVCSSDPRWIHAIWQNRGIPVVCSMAPGVDGEYYNVNADQMAAACAAACLAHALIFLTDVPGVKGADGEVLRWLDVERVPALAREGVLHGGMLPKLEACRQALRAGVPRVRILPAARAEALPQFFQTRIADGTEVTAGAAVLGAERPRADLVQGRAE